MLLIALCFPLSIDLFFCYLALKKNRTGTGASGVPFITLIFYGVFIFASPFMELYQKVLAFLLSVAVHVLLLFVIPYFDFRRLKSRYEV